MSRYVNDLPTPLSSSDVVKVAVEYLSGEGFEVRKWQGEDVWQKGNGWLVAPQFVKVVPGDRLVHIEAWVAGLALLPGVYFGEMDLQGAYGWAVKAALKPRVDELVRRLSGTA